MQTPKQEQHITISVADLASSDSADVIRVLHVDDDPCVLEVTKEILMIEGNFEIDQASSVDEALKKLETNHYDAVVSDYEMPQKNGLQFLKELREKKNEIPFILFTGKGREDVAIKALNLGSDAYINKAVATETVYGELSDALSKTMERKRSKKLLAASEIKYRTLIEDMSQGVVIVQGPQPHIVFANSAMEKITGFSNQELCSLIPPEIAKLIHPDDREVFFGRLSRRLRGQEPESPYEFKGIRKDGSMTWLEVRSSIIEYNGQRVVQGVFLDITQRKSAELELEQKYEALERVAESIGAGLAIIGKDYRVVWANAVLRNLGVSSAKKCYQTFNNLDMVCPDCGVKKVFEQNVPFDVHDYRAVNSKDEATWLELRVTPLKDQKGNVTAALELVVPITERRKAKEELENGKNYFETLMTSVLSGIIVVDSETRCIVDANPAALSLIGASKEEVVGKVCHKFICPAEKGKCPIVDLGQTIDKAERVVISANGERHPVIKNVVKAKHKGRTLLVENFVDISALKKIEEMMRNNQNRLELMNEKLKVVGVLTRHDVRNKLSAINGYSYLLKKRHADKPDIIDGLSKMEQSVKDSVRMFEFARVYEQLGVEELVDVSVEKTVNEAVGIFSDLTFKVVNDCHGLTVRADSLLRQLVYNLIDNTRKYGKKANVARVYYGKTVQGDIQLIYEDNGVGIPFENKAQLFKQGFSTGGSTGFGLFLSQKIMEVYGWAMTEEGEPGIGAKFVITIPSRLLGI